MRRDAVTRAQCREKDGKLVVVVGKRVFTLLEKVTHILNYTGACQEQAYTNKHSGVRSPVHRVYTFAQGR